MKNDKIIKLTIKKKNSLTIFDSINMFNGELAVLAINYGVNTPKSVFPYEFSTQNHLFYKGHTPDIDYYNRTSVKDYEKLWNENWSFKDESIKYLNNDLNCLYEVLISANKEIFDFFFLLNKYYGIYNNIRFGYENIFK